MSETIKKDIHAKVNYTDYIHVNLTCKIANKCLNVRERVGVVE